MSRCTDCGGPTPAPLWKRCEEHAMMRIRVLMGGEPAMPSRNIRRRFGKGDRVLVRVHGQEVFRPGTVGRASRASYGIDLDEGTRYYTESQDEVREWVDAVQSP